MESIVDMLAVTCHEWFTRAGTPDQYSNINLIVCKGGVHGIKHIFIFKACLLFGFHAEREEKRGKCEKGR